METWRGEEVATYTSGEGVPSRKNKGQDPVCLGRERGQWAWRVVRARDEGGELATA